MHKICFTVRGRVQGVGFRSFVRKTALAFGMVGWVKNNYDGSVSVEAQGPEKQVKLFIEKVRQGSFFSRVDELEIKTKENISELDRTLFEIRF